GTRNRRLCHKPSGDISFIECCISFPDRADNPRRCAAEAGSNLERVIQERPGYVVHREAPRWGTFVQSKPPPDGQVMGSDTAFGWPMRCMWYQMQSQYGMNRVWGERLYGGIVRSGQPSAVM